MYTEDTKVRHVLSMGTRTDDFNCWGATKFIADPDTQTLSWVDNEHMSEWLQSNYHPIKRTQIRQGDIVALFEGKPPHLRLIHTAYYVGGGKYVHKLGRNVARMESLQRVLRSYARECESFIFLRADKESEKCV